VIRSNKEIVLNSALNTLWSYRAGDIFGWHSCTK